jgi:hypothetical protein
MTPSELLLWAGSQPDSPLTDDELRKAWHWMMMIGPHSSWTNTEAKLVRVLILEVLRLRANNVEVVESVR